MQEIFQTQNGRTWVPKMAALWMYAGENVHPLCSEQELRPTPAGGALLVHAVQDSAQQSASIMISLKPKERQKELLRTQSRAFSVWPLLPLLLVSPKACAEPLEGYARAWGRLGNPDRWAKAEARAVASGSWHRPTSSGQKPAVSCKNLSA